jgi:UDP-hydrolysing UDP-N-acetyl-D-glucosamine 2-epimerase
MSRRKICVVTTNRADFGLVKGLVAAIRSDSALRLQLVVSGAHLDPQYGNTWKEVAREGGPISRKVALGPSGQSAADNLRSIGRGVSGFTEAYAALRPAIVVLVGDRFELLAAAIPALLLRIPIAHIHGGERSEGAIDEAVRHAITKMASIHFAAAEEYRRRIIQMGEEPERVFTFGAPGLDELHRSPLLSRAELERQIGFSLKEPTALVTYHPATLDPDGVERSVRRLAAALQRSRLQAIVTMANADEGGNRINAVLRKLCSRHPERFKWIPHLGHLRYLSCLRFCAVMIGNSSSGLTEAPSFKLPVVNLGERQRGRLRAANVIDTPESPAAIDRAIDRALSPRFRASLRRMHSPYDSFRDGRASERIKNVLKNVTLSPEWLKKSFYDLPTLRRP